MLLSEYVNHYLAFLRHEQGPRQAPETPTHAVVQMRQPQRQAERRLRRLPR